MKKALMIVIALVVLFAVWSCSSTAAEQPQEQQAAQETQEQPATESVEDWPWSDELTGERAAEYCEKWPDEFADVTADLHGCTLTEAAEIIEGNGLTIGRIYSEMGTAIPVDVDEDGDRFMVAGACADKWSSTVAVWIVAA